MKIYTTGKTGTRIEATVVTTIMADGHSTKTKGEIIKTKCETTRFFRRNSVGIWECDEHGNLLETGKTQAGECRYVGVFPYKNTVVRYGTEFGLAEQPPYSGKPGELLPGCREIVMEKK